ncbi:DUF6445 family protein [Steroidobacter cummioxidans]|uniref:DUF6445 family protein n=1 Tax=Steroidobacter cummioxidans TaxID=1803913 RepID=UPI000E31E074|nr:DUF6445 family protein [Steroidobacter cummioxidans]
MDDGAHDTTVFAFNPNAHVELVSIGRRGIKVCVIDDVLRDPEGVAALGFAQSYAEDSSNLYPGLRAAMPERFSSAFRAWLTPMLQRHGVLERNQTICRDTSFFSVVTTASEDLLPIQCIPHYDSKDPNLFAAVIYLCGARFSGTAFYRHRRTGYEEITEDNVSNYKIALNSDLRTHGAPKRDYINGDTLLFETIFSTELQFNRAIVYPARILHAAKIDSQFHRPKDRSEWRLTVTALLLSASVDRIT